MSHQHIDCDFRLQFDSAPSSLATGLPLSIMNDAVSIIVGLLLVILAGSLNGSWNASFSPQLGLAVGKQRESNDTDESNRPDLEHHLAWVLFQVYASLLNLPLCLYWAGGPKRVGWIVSSESNTLLLVLLFSILWGIGSVCFGMACRIAGVGLGTNLTMGGIMVLGTLLPLIIEKVLATASGAIIGGGIAVSCAGLVLAVLSLRTRDQDAAKDRQAKEEESEEGQAVQEHSTAYKATVCLVAAIFSSCLQFAFIFGEDWMDLASSDKGPGSTPSSGAAAVIWLFAIPLGAPASIIYGLYSSQIPFSTVWKCPPHRHLLVLLTTSLPFVVHIHLYGLATSFLPDSFAAAIAWPILMMVTVAVGMVWSLLLGEWATASSQARRQLYAGLGVVLVGIVIIMSSTAVS